MILLGAQPRYGHYRDAIRLKAARGITSRRFTVLRISKSVLDQWNILSPISIKASAAAWYLSGISDEERGGKMAYALSILEKSPIADGKAPPGAGAHAASGATGGTLGLSAFLAGGAPQHAAARLPVAGSADRLPARPDVAHSHRLRRRDAATLQRLQGGRKLLTCWRRWRRGALISGWAKRPAGCRSPPGRCRPPMTDKTNRPFHSSCRS